MNLEYLGDALDHWKGSLFEYLQSEGVLRDLAVDPMATDRDQWKEADYCLFARLLRIPRHQLIEHRASLITRDRYFAEVVHDGDLFLDPDTGIATPRSSPVVKYVKPRELANLLRSVCGRVISVYQHVRAVKTSLRVDQCVAAIKKETDVFGWCTYESPTVAMLFVCNEEVRTRDIETALKRLLGSHAKRRVRSGQI